MSTLSVIAFIMAFMSGVMVFLVNKSYKRLIQMKDEQIRRLSKAAVYRDSIALRLPLLDRYVRFEVVESRYFYGVYGISADTTTKSLLYISAFNNVESREKAKQEVREIVKELNDWKSCVV